MIDERVNRIPAALDQSILKAAILRSLEDRDAAKSICPSEIARQLADDRAWRPLMPIIRSAVAQLVEERRVIITRGTKILKSQEMAGGSIRIRRGPRFGTSP